MISKKAKLLYERKTYRCPACGKMVDNRDREAARFHHDHVLRPRQEPVIPNGFLAAFRTGIGA
jgi:hypothetical protein